LAPGVTPVTPKGDTHVTRTIKNQIPPNPPADAEDSGTPDHCDKHSRFRNGCDNCAKARAKARRKPAWCGTCDKRTRLRDYDSASPRRCPECHPLESRTGVA
jgi:hypothetical protein